MSTVVVIPVLDAASTIRRQFDALDRQTVLDFRVVVSDNGSTDETVTLCHSWQSKFAGLDVVDASARRGVAHARNVGISSSSEPLILICDADDRVHRAWVESMREGLTQADGVTGPLHLVSEDMRGGQVVNPDAVPVSMNYLPYLPGGNLGIHRAVFTAVGHFDEDMALGQEDVDFGWRMARAGFRLGHHTGASLDYFQRAGLRPLMRQQFRYGRAHVALFSKHRRMPDAPAVASLPHSLRWFLIWARQLPGRVRDKSVTAALGHLAFQLGRLWECAARRTLSPL
ncbi:glycosyltransferase family 2 protein [Tessaracoccus sp. Y1736]